MTSARWIWYPGDFEIYHNMLLHARREEFGCDYPCMWHVPRPEYSCRFHKTFSLSEAADIAIDIKGKGFARIDGRKAPLPGVISLAAGEHTLTVEVNNIEAFPALFCAHPALTSGKDWLCDRFTAKRVPAACEPALEHRQDPAVFPFVYKPIPVVSETELEGGVLYDFGVESFGPITLTRTADMGEIHVVYGESAEEATDEEDALVRQTLAPEDGTIRLRSRAFRYVFVRAEHGKPAISAELEYLPIDDIASFTCDDPLIAPIWEICSRTFHLNSREFYLDGIKRDRWCWSGDAYQSYMVNRYLYFEPSIIRRTIRALLGKQPYEQHINTINDYSAYLIIAVWEYYFATGDLAFVESIADDLYALYTFITARLDAETGYVVARPGDWIFIDWANIDKNGALCAEQILLWQTYRAMAKLSALTPAIPANGYEAKADTLRASILRDFWDDARGGFIDSYTSGKNNITRHANIFAILYDFVDADTADRIYREILCGDIAEPITTPYFKFFELMALGKMGDIVGTQNFIDSYWGGMLSLGATSVWEQFDPRKEGRAHLEMYGMEYGCSLCHAWGSGPIALLGQFCAGVTPTDVAYKTFDVKPNPGKYNTFRTVVPVCGGTVTVSYEKDTVTATATVSGGTLHFNGRSAAIPENGSVTL